MAEVLQIAHGKIIPKMVSAYSLRCHRMFDGYENRKLISIGGVSFKDAHIDYYSQFRAIILTGSTLLSRVVPFQILLTNGFFVRKIYKKSVINYIADANAIVFEGPWQYYIFKKFLSGKKVIYDALNVESFLWKKRVWRNFVRKLETNIIARADLVIAITKEDEDLLSTEFNIERNKIVLIQDGFQDIADSWNGIDSNKIVFIGSAYAPNVIAAKYILNIAKSLPEYDFVLIGNVCDRIRNLKRTPNVKLMGILDEKEKNELINESLLGLNLVTEGSGRNYKMDDYIKNGVPILTTDIGARGYPDIIRRTFFITKLEDVSNIIVQIAKDKELLRNVSNRLTEYANDNDHTKSVNKYVDYILRLNTEK